VSRLSRAAAGLWDFVVGDDPVTGLGVIVALAVTAVVASAGVAAWWVMPVAAVGLLAVSLLRASR
jgi:Na+-transporting NADH:ubiquinone oxidoreductase subunit NqrD